MIFSNSSKLHKKTKKTCNKIPSDTLRLKGQRCYNQRSTASLVLTPCTKKHLVQGRLFNRFSRNASKQRPKSSCAIAELPFRPVAEEQRDSQEKTPDHPSLNEGHVIGSPARCTSKQTTVIAEQNKADAQDKRSYTANLKTQRAKLVMMKSRQKVMSIDRNDNYRLANELNKTIYALKTKLRFREEDVEKSSDVFEKNIIMSAKRSAEERKAIDLLQCLLSQKHFKVKPVVIDVYNVTDNTVVENPKSVEGIPWYRFREEKYRLHSFFKYPLTAAKSAMLLAEDGFAYTGKGADKDDTVTCYFCSVQKNGWQTIDIVSDIHREMSPNCSMVTKINCDNIPIRFSQNDVNTFNRLLDQLNPKCSNNLGHHPLMSSGGNCSDKPGNVSQHSMDIDADCASDARQNDLMFNQPTSTSENTLVNKDIHSEDVRRATLTSNTSTFQHPFPTQGSTTSRQQANLPNRSTQTTHSSMSVIQDVSSVPSTSLITLPAISSEPRNPETNDVPGNSNFLGNTSLPQAKNLNTEIAASSASPTVSQTPIINDEKKNGKGPSYAELGIITERPKRPEYAVKETRMKTFERWPRSFQLKPEDLSDAGFYYAGYSDCARCFYCGGGLRNWEDEDDVWVEHARWFPKCAYIRQQMGQVFVDTVQELNKTLDVISFATVKERCSAPGTASTLDAKMEPLKKDPAVLTVAEFGYSLSDVLQVAKIIKGKDVIISSDILLSKLQELKKPRIAKTPDTLIRSASSSTLAQDEEAIRQLKQRNNQLRQQTVCKICMDKEVAVVFLPCGHLVSCAECASAMKDCPVCRVTVKGVVRAFI